MVNRALFLTGLGCLGAFCYFIRTAGWLIGGLLLLLLVAVRDANQRGRR